MDLYIQPGAGAGRIGPFWWINGDHEARECIGFYGLADNPSRHLAWRTGGCGWAWGRRPLINPVRWYIIKTLN